ncbi:MAG: DNA polymerase III subunit alpha [Brevinema sp.]
MSHFVNLHVFSHYSILQAIPTIDELIDVTKKHKQSALALTDYNHLFGVPEFQKKAKGIKPIFGMTIDVMEQSRFSSQKKDDPPITKYTVVLLAKNFNGYQNILKISSQGYDDGFFGRFCVDKTLLGKFAQDIIVLSSDHTGELYHHALKQNTDKLLETITFYQNTFGKENFYIEIQDRGINDDKIANNFLINIAREHHIPLVATNPVKYINPEDHKLLEIVSCIKEKDFITEKTPSTGPFYFRSTEEMIELFQNIPEAIENTVTIAEMCHVEFPKEEDQSPIYPIPEGMTTGEFLREKSKKELTKKLNHTLPPEYEERLDWELDTVCMMGFPNYFLVVSDFVQYAKKNGILVGPGRGSAAGALLSYALGITNVDPLRYDLLFERFLNPERISMPDIDIDFEDERRDEVKEYLRSHYGNDKTADVVTFGYNKAKAVLKDVGRVLEIPLPRVNQISGMVDANEYLGDQVQKNSEIKSILDGSNTKEKEWITYSVKLTNRIRNLGTHASALIVAKQPLNNVIPLFKDRSNTTTTSFEGKYLEENGLLKMDILGLSNLSIIRDCIETIYHNHQIWIDLDTVPLDDQKVFDMFSVGHTAGIFQFESTGMTNYIKQLKPTSIEDLIAMNALYRPGPMDNILSFINRKQGREEIDCYHKNLEPVLKNTYGIIVYQEQVMQIAQILSGFSLGEADLVRRIMAKKKPDELEVVRPKWINGAIAQGYDEKLAEHLFEQLIPFSNYAFNKSHAAAYSILAYQIAWLKAHYPAEFMASLMSSNMGRHEDLKKYIGEARKLGITVLPPNINKSLYKFSVERIEENDTINLVIRYGFGAIKGIGEQAIKEIINEREWGGKYTSIEDFVERTAHYNDIRKACLEILIKSASFDSLLDSENLSQQKAIFLDPRNLNSLYQKFEKKEDTERVVNLFSSEELEAAASETIQTKGIPPLSFEQDFQNEIKTFGFYFTGKLFQEIEKNIGMISTYKDILKDTLPLGTTVSAIGYISDVHIVNPNPSTQLSHSRRSWGKFSLNTEEENFSFFLFSEKLATYESMLQEGNFVFVKMNISKNNKKDILEYDLKNLSLLNSQSKIRHYELNIILENNHQCNEFNEWATSLHTLSKQDKRTDAEIHIIFHIIEGNQMKTLKSASYYAVHKSEKLFDLLKKDFIQYYWFV